MKLTDLEPHIILKDNTPIGITFKCPHCIINNIENYAWLTCFHQKTDSVSRPFGQYYCIREALKNVPNIDYSNIVPCRKDFAWTFSSNDFATLSITPSLDASASGHWHGFITNGEIV